MAKNFKLNKELQNYYRERDTILDEVCTGQINNELLKAAIIKFTDNLIYHLMRLIENSQVKPRKQERNKNNKSRNTKEERKIMQLRKEAAIWGNCNIIPKIRVYSRKLAQKWM